MIDWTRVDTVLLDMDGTLLDLNFDNVLWTQRLPHRYAEHHGLDHDEARDALFAHMHETRHTLEFYCLDYWTRHTRLDIVGLHHELSHLIRWRGHARMFIHRITGSGRRAVLVTNAHRKSLAVKDDATDLTSTLDASVSAHDYAAPKESPAFWEQLHGEEPFDPQRTLFIDDNATVLDAARDYGVRQLVTVSQPDSARPARDEFGYPAFNQFDEIMP
jgi:putative hydrolase of the HAD superfamily